MKVFRSIVPLLLLTGVLAGCSKKAPTSAVPSGTTGAEQAKIAAALATQPALLDDGVSDSGDIMPVSLTLAGGALPASAIQPLRFWRTITSRERTFEFSFADTDSTGKPTSAVVVIHTTLKGRFNILVGVPGTDSTPMDSTLRTIHKPLEDESVRRVLLRRVTRKDGWHHEDGDEGDEPGEEDDHESAWKIVGTSLARVTSPGAVTHIQSVRLQSGTIDTTITDPLSFFRLRRLPCIAAQDTVVVTVTTLRNDDVVVFASPRRHFRFHNNGDNTYTGVWRTGLFFHGLNQVGVNALSNGTVFDDVAPYDSDAWVLPHTFFPESLAEFLP
jgi:hypothetical protein